MFSNHLDVYGFERANELLREAQKVRLVKEALAGQKAHSPLLRRALGGLGRWMVLRGSHLQHRYGAMPLAQMPRAADRKY